jgi:hypothetical protein
MQMKYQQGLLQADTGIYLCSYMIAALPNESSHKTTKLIVMSSDYKIIEHRQTLGTFDITCQRVSAWQCCMDGVAFLWERVNFGPRQNKNHPTDQDQIWQA